MRHDLTLLPLPRSRTKRSPRLSLECLEARELLTVTYHGGPLLAHVEVQALYLGADWSNVPTEAALSTKLDAFLSSTVQSPYMDMLTQAGYNVGRGSASPGVVDPLSPPKGTPLSDTQIRQAVQNEINLGKLQGPDANRLYVVFVQANVAVQAYSEISTKDFLGYHDAFAGTSAQGKAATLRYAVITYPGGTVGNASLPGLSTLDDMSVPASHELVESATDPDVELGSPGWYDDQQNEEIADLAANQYIYLNGYAVQEIADKNDQPMTPTGAAPGTPVNFALLQNGQLLLLTPTGVTTVASGVKSVSSQGIDNSGRAMVDYVTSSGSAYEYHAGASAVLLGSSIKSAMAGNGVSYVLYSNGNLYEYHDVSNSWTGIASGIASIDAGTDRYGVNMVDMVETSGFAWEYSDSTTWHYLASSVKQVSAGHGGASVILLQNGSAEQFTEATASLTSLGSGIAQVTAGTDASGNVLIELLTTGGTAYQVSGGTRTTLWTGVLWIGKAHSGAVDLVLSNNSLFQHNSNGWLFLASAAAAGA